MTTYPNESQRARQAYQSLQRSQKKPQQTKQPYQQRQTSQPVKPEEKTHIPYTNEITINGKLGGDPELLTINSHPCYKFSLAHWQPKGKPVIWFKVYAYNEELHPIISSLHKGSEVLISGKFTYEVFNNTPMLGILLNSLMVNEE
jgi:hypothetical protein